MCCKPTFSRETYLVFQTSSYLNTFGFVVMQIDFCEEQLTFDDPEIEKKISN